MSNEQSDEYQHYLKYDGNEDFWDEWSDKNLSIANLMGFYLAYASNTNPCRDAAYTVSTDKDKRRI